MTTLTAIKFPTVGGADAALKTLHGLERQDLIQVFDMAEVVWEVGKDHPKTRHVHTLAGPLALGGMFWGMLFGLIFFIPVVGAAVGLGVGALTGSMVKMGIDRDFIDSVKEKVTPGTSALFVVTARAKLDRVEEAFRGQEFEIVATNLSHEEEEQLRQAFSHEPEEEVAQ